MKKIDKLKQNNNVLNGAITDSINVLFNVMKQQNLDAYDYQAAINVVIGNLIYCTSLQEDVKND